MLSAESRMLLLLLTHPLSMRWGRFGYSRICTCLVLLTRDETQRMQHTSIRRED